MSGKATGWVLQHGPRPEDKDGDGNPYGLGRARAYRAILTAIADAANADGRHSHPGSTAISDASLYSPGYVRRVIGELVDDGWVEIEEAGGGRGKATVYRVMMGREETAPHARVSEDGPEDETRAQTRASAPGNPRIEQAKPAPPEAKPAHGMGPDQPFCDANGLPNDEPPTEGLSTTPLFSSPTFDDFWDVYPRHEDKKEAHVSWNRVIRSVDPAVVVAGAIRYRNDPNRVRTFTKLPTTWLNKGCWDNDPLPPRLGAATGTGTNGHRLDAKEAMIERIKADGMPNR